MGSQGAQLKIVLLWGKGRLRPSRAVGKDPDQTINKAVKREKGNRINKIHIDSKTCQRDVPTEN